MVTMASNVDATNITQTNNEAGLFTTGNNNISSSQVHDDENKYFELRIPENIVDLQEEQNLATQDLQEFEKYKNQGVIENFKVEVFRCKSCRYRCIFREEIVQHIKNVHYDVDREMSSIATVIDVLMEGLSSEVQKSQQYVQLNVNSEMNSVNQNAVASNINTQQMQTNPEENTELLNVESTGVVSQEVLSNIQQDEETSFDSLDHVEDNSEECEPIPFPTAINRVLHSGVDLSAIAKSAANCNPNATKITVFQHLNSSETPTAIHFRKSRKSDAIIPTNDSLGISSPFLSSSYRGKKHFACTQCHSRYKTEKELTNHIQKKHKRGQSVLCEICGVELASQMSAKHHAARMHKARGDLLKCDKCDYVTRFKKRLEIHMARHDSEFFCVDCKKSYVSKQKLEKHYQSPMHKHIVNPLICEHCGYSSNKKDNFLVHMRKHTGEKPYKCNHCSYASADGSTLKKHVMAKHSNIRPFKCEWCPFSSVDKKGLTVHVRKHTGERPFRCNQCNYAAKRRSALKLHMQTHVQGSDKKASEDKVTKVPQIRNILPMPGNQTSNAAVLQNQALKPGIIQVYNPGVEIQTQNTSGVQSKETTQGVMQSNQPCSSGSAQIQAPSQNVMQNQVTNLSGTQPQAPSLGVAQMQASNPNVTQIQISNPGVAQLQSQNPGVSQMQTSNPGVPQMQVSNPVVTQIHVPNPGVAQMQVSNPGVMQIQAPNPGVAQM